jgi:hypothetical protein
VSSTIELLSWWLRESKPLTVEQVAEIHERVVLTPAVNAEEINLGRAARRARRAKTR